ncbi:replication initiation and membrane attachment family protein [Halobacillus naozhouensis]|uniref:DnaD domain protein n=1 Tax=Halobacillus naozhouensis TaxID=554880 RepID=A0ABY8IXG5_9BACI|nr:DnaD domain protein [Halobacillus naozhouensis]WFT73466.1 DnaD domain protein [Halobacillus naozhouensis]
MDRYIGKLLPIDGFRIIQTGSAPQSAQWSLTHLYQPLIGKLAISLYQFLVNEYETCERGFVQSHHAIMAFLSTPLDQVYKARQKLEALGLLRTYLSKKEATTVYLYEIRPPFSPEEFFNDDMLSLLLRHEMGEDKFKSLRTRFSLPTVSVEEYEEVTETFDRVFHGVYPSSALLDQQKQSAQRREGTVSRGPAILNSRVDFNWLHHALKQRMYPSEKILTGDHRRIISQLVALYNLTSSEIERAIIWAINEENELIIDELKAACHDYMKDRPSAENGSIDEREKVPESTNKEAGNKEEQFIQLLEEISPRELLEDLSNGNQASEQEMKIIRDIMTEQGLQPGVMNVLIHYVLLKTDMKLSKPYLEKIASHWARKNVSTVRQAMNLAKAEHQKYQQWGKQRNTYRKKNTNQEVIPDWFKKRGEPKEKQPAAPINKQDIAERIRKLSNKGNES